jgi:hypothetical protein
MAGLHTKRLTHLFPALVLNRFPIYKLFCLKRSNRQRWAIQT